jgi:hypothetical protein
VEPLKKILINPFFPGEMNIMDIGIEHKCQTCSLEFGSCISEPVFAESLGYYGKPESDLVIECNSYTE